MWLVLADVGDSCASWAVEELRRRGLVPLELVTSDALAHTSRWTHRLGGSGAAAAVELADGRVIRSVEVRGVLNRLTTVPVKSAEAAIPPEDREYVASELYSFYLGWLRTLGPAVLNPATPRGLCGEWRHLSEWTLLAARAGLPVRKFRRAGEAAEPPRPESGPTEHAVVVGNHVIAAAPLMGLEEGCARLSGLAGTPLLEVTFALVDASRPVFAGASPLPCLEDGGAAVADALAAALVAAADLGR